MFQESTEQFVEAVRARPGSTAVIVTGSARMADQYRSALREFGAAKNGQQIILDGVLIIFAVVDSVGEAVRLAGLHAETMLIDDVGMPASTSYGQLEWVCRGSVSPLYEPKIIRA